MDEAIRVFFILAAVVGGPLLAVMLVPALVKRVLGSDSARRREHLDGEAQRELDALAQRVAELEERVDFAERLLTQQREGILRPGS